jgi:nitrite reductase (cytochrome c-552)
MKSIQDVISEKPYVGWLLFFATLVIVFLVGLFGASIIERRSEAHLVYEVVRPVQGDVYDNSQWQGPYPRQYNTYLETRDTTFQSKYGGAASIDMLERYPKMVILWAGYAFSKGYNQGRGHYWALQDVRQTLRTAVPQPATCWTCKSPAVPRLMNEMGVEEFYASSWEELGGEIQEPIGCADCHDPETLDLTITRPALVEALEAADREIKEVSHQEMRSLVCAQCHVEYYFIKNRNNYLKFPWDNGLDVEAMEKYYDTIEHVDFVHALSKTPIIKAQHPDYEISRFGIHAQRGVSCADCHMPYRSEGGIKFTDHHIQSPLNMIDRSCQVCHRESEETLRQNVYDNQDRVRRLLAIAEETLVKAHIEAKAAWDAGATEAQMAPILTFIRRGQWRWDYISASHGAGFHAPLESATVLGTAIQRAEEARSRLAALLTELDVEIPVELPDLSTKEKAQEYIGFDLRDLSKQKEIFLETKVPQWDKEVSIPRAERTR